MPLTLTLAVTGASAAQFGARGLKSFSGRGGTIGRSEDCDWVLAASGVSRIHAMVQHLNGMYFIEDRSTNGMLLNGVPLVKGEPAALSQGDRLMIDAFEIAVELKEGLAASTSGPMPAAPFTRPAAFQDGPAMSPPAGRALPGTADDPFDFGFLEGAGGAPAAGASPRSQPPPPSAMPPMPDFMGGASSGGAGGIDDLLAPSGGLPADDADPLSFLGPAPTAAAPAAAASSWNHSSGAADHFRPPSVPAASGGGGSALPENWDLTLGDFAPKPSRSAPPPSGPSPAPLASSAPTPVPVGSVPAEVDAIFRIVVEGVMDVLRARAEIKNTFRLPVTIIQRSENNPLKFAPNAEVALQNILQPSNGAFLAGTAAFQDAFDDIRCHQMAMLAGVRAAFNAMLAHFSPERFEGDGEAARRGGLMDFSGRGSKIWDRYRENFASLSRDPDDAFRRLFGDEFARAYEEQLARLKSARKLQQAKGR